MAELEKLLCTDSKVESLKKINAMVDAMGDGDLANKDLSNLTAEGEAKFDAKVSKSGDTMTGSLTIQAVTGGFLQGVRTGVNLGDTPSSQQNIGGFRCYAGEPVEANIAAIVQGYISTAQSQSISGLQFITRKPDNSGWGAGLQLQTRADGNTYFSFPMCTTKATTTSSASANKVAVVTQNYVNGTSWYRVWSDGWKEQGGQYRTTTTQRQTWGVITFLKPFSNTNYNVQAVPHSLYRTATLLVYMGMASIGNKTTTKVDVGAYGVSDGDRNDGFDWYACGY